MDEVHRLTKESVSTIKRQDLSSNLKSMIPEQMTVVVLNVIGRRIAGLSILGTVEVVELSGVFMVSCIAAYTQLQRQNIAVTILTDRMSPRLRRAFDSFGLFIGLLIMAGLAWTGFVEAQQMAVGGELTGDYELPKAPFRFVWVFGCITLFIVLTAQFIGSLGKAVRK